MGRDVQPALRHQRQQAHRLQRHRLAARVGAGDHQGEGLRVQVDIDRHHRGGLQQGVARLVQADARARVADGDRAFRLGGSLTPRVGVSLAGWSCAHELSADLRS